MKPNQERLDFWNDVFNSLKPFTLQDLRRRYKRDFRKGKEAKEISERTMKADFKKLRDLNAPLETKRFENQNETLGRDEKCHYSYTQSFELYPKLEFTSEDAKRIQEIVSILKQFQYLPHLEDLKEVLFKIEQQLNSSNTSSDEISYLIAFEQVPKLRGIHRLRDFYNAIIAKEVQFMYYKPFDKPMEQVTLHPYFLKQFRNRWFIYGLNADAQKVLPYALDRIERVESGKLPFTNNTYIDFKTFFVNRIGITYFDGDELCKIRLKVQKARAYYMLTKPWHPSQILDKETDTYMIFELELVLNKELEAQILEFGKDIEVLEPLSLRQNIYNILNEAISRYQ
jgi:predicted DNA-binding transcriptional regulator YafY